MMLGRELKLSDSELHAVGMGALFHDVGKMEVDPKVSRKIGELSRHEQALLQTHVEHGIELSKKLGLSTGAALVVAQHHEFVDGSGYPKRLKASQISLLARVVSVVNEFDYLCNPSDPAKAMTPHEALSLLYGQKRARFDAKVIATFVRCMGIYPPGTLVVLSNGSLGMVVSVNSSRPLKPSVLVFDPAARRSEAIVVDLEREPDVSVVKTLRPAQLTSDAMSYLAPRKRTTYYFDAQPGNT
jgi:HD-GYP domain-containing protein (c-di-GMP phosphodiesterase class II)